MKGIIENGKIIAVRWKTLDLPLKKPVSLREYEKFEEAVETCFEYIDFEKTLGMKEKEIKTEEYGEFDEETMKRYLSYNTAVQDAFFQILTIQGNNYIPMNELLKKMGEKTGKKFKPLSIAGMASGLKKKQHWYQKESLYEQEWSEELWMNKYRLKSKYLDMVKKYYNK